MTFLLQVQLPFILSHALELLTVPYQLQLQAKR